jgi:NET1-associated nuclear protein 1 (U3 small nucleolar RNA-associated protein 17)
VAVGNDKGKITLHHDVGGAGAPVPSTYHWHSHAVASVVFNSDGTYMLSGGEEAVLVIWQLETGAKRTLPRLGA